MMVDHTLRFTIPAAYALLPREMDSERATALILAIGLQESEFRARRQYQRGPAKGYWEFELRGVKGVLTHPRSAQHAETVIDALCYRMGPRTSPARQAVTIYDAMADNDTLGCCWARLLLWTLPVPLPGPDEATAAWGQYTAAWKPGKPRPETWAHNYGEAWARVRAGEQAPT